VIQVEASPARPVLRLSHAFANLPVAVLEPA